MTSIANGQRNGANRPATAGTTDIPLGTLNSAAPQDDGTQEVNLSNSTPGKNDSGANDRLIPSVDLQGQDSNANGEVDLPPELNIYRNRKTLTQGLMDIALFSANANQLRYILEAKTMNIPIYITMALIIISLVLQIAVGILLLLSTRYTICAQPQRKIVYKYGNYALVGTFLITIINTFIAAFGGSAVPAS